MLEANYKRHGVKAPTRANVISEFSIFKNKTKLFVALLNDEPLVTLECNYTLSTCYLSMVGSYSKGTDDVNKFCYKVAIEDACDHGYKYANLGLSFTEGLASLKDRLKFIRVPTKTYEKRYSFFRVLIELASSFINGCLHYQKHMWGYRRMFWDRIIHW
jgi:hypothetical protein